MKIYVYYQKSAYFTNNIIYQTYSACLRAKKREMYLKNSMSSDSLDIHQYDLNFLKSDQIGNVVWTQYKRLAKLQESRNEHINQTIPKM